MKVVVSCDAIAGLSAREASEVVASAFHQAGAQVAVAVLGVEGESLVDALAPVRDVEVIVPESVSTLGPTLSGLPAGRYLVDLTGLDVEDLGRELLAAFDPDPSVALEKARSATAHLELMAVVADDEATRPLTGLSGLASTAGRAAGLDIRQVLEADARAEAWLTQLGLEDGPGCGAAGGLGLLLIALGAKVVDGITVTADLLGLTATMRQADLVVTGAHLLDFHAVGGPIVKRVAAMGEEALRPVVAVVGRNFVSARELRLAGIESASGLVPAGAADEPTKADLVRVAAQLAATWTW